MADNSDNHSSLTKTAFIITLITAGGRIIGFLREAVIAYVFGAGAVTDAYTVALRIMTTAGLLTSVYLTTTFVPSYIRVREQQGDDASLRVANNVLGVALAINLFIVVALLFTSPFILNMTTGFDEQQMAFAVISVSILLFKLPFRTFVKFFSGYLNARKSFFAPKFTSIPTNVAFIAACLILGTASGIRGLSVASLIGAVVGLLIFFFWLPKEQYRYRFSMRFNTPEIRSDMKILMPALVGSALVDLKAWVDTMLATFLGEGNAAAIGFSNRLLGFVSGLFVIPLATIAYSYMSSYAAKNDTQKMLDILWKTMRVILFVVLPMIIIAVPSSFDVVQIVFERGEFSPDATLLTGTALMGYLPGLLGLSMYIFLVRFFYGLSDTRTPMISGMVAMLVNIALSIFLSQRMGIIGITLASSVGHTLSALLLLALLRRKMGRLNFRSTAISIAKMAVAAIPCAIAVLAMTHLLSSQHTIIRFAAVTVTAGSVYLVTALLLKETVAHDLLRMVKKRLLRR